jgi:hypothetical protein
MPATIIYGDKASQVASAFAEGDNLWLSLEDVHRSTGWELKPEGLCQGDRCVPIPPRRRDEFIRPDNSLNLNAFARHLGQPVVHDDVHAVWFFGESAEARRNELFSLQAPDFSLPDLDGKLHSLSDYRGRKILLLSWASW